MKYRRSSLRKMDHAAFLKWARKEVEDEIREARRRVDVVKAFVASQSLPYSNAS